MVARELGGDQVRALEVGDADREVEALVLEVDQPLREVQRDLQIGMLGDECGEVGGDVAPSERGGRRDDQPPRRAFRADRQRILRGAQLLEQPMAILVEGRSLGRPTIAGVIPSSRAAAERLPRWATSTKVVSSLNRSMACEYKLLRESALFPPFQLGNRLGYL
jgi:hypothetical protein